jgi:hypothetical protein
MFLSSVRCTKYAIFFVTPYSYEPLDLVCPYCLFLVHYVCLSDSPLFVYDIFGSALHVLSACSFHPCGLYSTTDMV